MYHLIDCLFVTLILFFYLTELLLVEWNGNGISELIGFAGAAKEHFTA